MIQDISALHSDRLDKNALRIELLAARQRLSESEAREAAQAVAALLATSPLPSQMVIAGYHPVRGELDIREALVKLEDHGHTICLPVIEAAEQPLYFRKWVTQNLLEPGRYGILAPPAGAPVLTPDLLLVPLVAFDARGNRVGYGAGYYDRTLTRIRQYHPRLQAVGIGYSFQQVTHISAESHDEKLDAIVTEKGWIACNP